MAFAIVVVNHRSAEMTARCLQVAAADGPGEVVVVDHSPEDPESQRLHELGVTVLERPNRGFAAGVNAGFQATTADTVLLLNPDTEPAPGALRQLVAHIEANPQVGVAAPRMLEPDGRPQPSAYRRDPNLALLFVDLCLPVGWLAMKVPALDAYRLPPHEWRPGRRVAHATGAALAVRRAAYDAAGPLDEGFFLYLEETEWQRRVRRAGYGIELVPGAVVTHLVRGGGHESLAPSPHFLASARRYLRRRGHSRLTIEAMLATALLLSRLAARAENLFIPAERRTGGTRAAAYDELWRHLRE